MSLPSTLSPASFAGVPFAVDTEDADYGRRLALHEYPYRDKPYPEDMGRATRVQNIIGFLLTNAAAYVPLGDAMAQRDAMVAAAETPGEAELVLPTLGSLRVKLLRLKTIARTQQGGGSYFELRFFFYESGDRLYPTFDGATGDATNAATDTAQSAVDQDFEGTAQGALPQGQPVVRQAVTTTAQWTAIATSLARDATGIAGIASSLAGNFGRYVGGRNAGGLTTPMSGLSSTAQSFTSVDAAIAAATAARTTIGIAATALKSLAGSLSLPVATIDDYSTGVQTLAAALRSAINDPADAVRLLSQLSDFQPSAVGGADPIGMAMSDMAAACGDLFRRTAIIELARATTVYQPSSSNDAYKVMSSVVALLDAEIEIAGDQFDDQSFAALQALRTAVIQDMTKRGANLPAVITFEFPQPLPAAVLAGRLYNDVTRTDELIAEVDPVHPLFMPTTFDALGS